MHLTGLLVRTSPWFHPVAVERHPQGGGGAALRVVRPTSVARPAARLGARTFFELGCVCFHGCFPLFQLVHHEISHWLIENMCISGPCWVVKKPSKNLTFRARGARGACFWILHQLLWKGNPEILHFWWVSRSITSWISQLDAMFNRPNGPPP